MGINGTAEREEVVDIFRNGKLREGWKGWGGFMMWAKWYYCRWFIEREGEGFAILKSYGHRAVIDYGCAEPKILCIKLKF